MSNRKGKKASTALYDRRVAQLRYFCPIVCSFELKREIVRRIEENNVDIYMLLKGTNVNYQTFMNEYIKKYDMESCPGVRASNIIQVAEKLGINVRVTMVLTREENFDFKNFKKND